MRVDEVAERHRRVANETLCVKLLIMVRELTFRNSWSRY